MSATVTNGALAGGSSGMIQVLSNRINERVINEDRERAIRRREATANASPGHLIFAA